MTQVLCAGLERAYKTKGAWDTLPAPKPSLREIILPVGRKIIYSPLKEKTVFKNGNGLLINSTIKLENASCGMLDVITWNKCQLVEGTIHMVTIHAMYKWCN